MMMLCVCVEAGCGGYGAFPGQLCQPCVVTLWPRQTCSVQRWERRWVFVHGRYALVTQYVLNRVAVLLARARFQGARAPGLPPTGGLLPNASYFFVRDMCMQAGLHALFCYLLVLHFQSLGFCSLSLSGHKWAGPQAPHQLNPALLLTVVVVESPHR